MHFLEGVRWCFLLQWPMTTMWPSASNSITAASWTDRSALG
jgi:hypothetical protein